MSLSPVVNVPAIAFVTDISSGSGFKLIIPTPTSLNLVILSCTTEIIGDNSYPEPKPVAFTLDIVPICKAEKPNASIILSVLMACVFPDNS